MKIICKLLLLFVISNSFAASTWKKEVSSVPWSERSGTGVLFFKNKLWMFSGSTKDIWSSTNGSTWVLKDERVPWSSSLKSIIVFNNKIWAFAHDSNGGGIYSSENGTTWIKKVNRSDLIWTNRYYFYNVIFDNRIWLIGGYEWFNENPDGVFKDKNDVYSSPDGINWTKENDFYKWGSSGHTVVPFNNKMWVFGGERTESPNIVLPTPDGYNAKLNTIFSYSNGNWTKNNNASWLPRSGHDTLIFDNKIWLIGGSGWNNFNDKRKIPYDDVWSSVDGVSWKKENDISWLKGSSPTVFAFNDKLWVMNGRLNEIWSLDSNIVQPSLDIDGNGKSKGFTDGFLIIRYLLGAKENTLIDGLIAADATRSTSKIEQYLNDNKMILFDVDGNGKAKGFTDGFLIIRYLLGARGNTLIDGLIADDATRTTASEIEAFLKDRI